MTQSKLKLEEDVEFIFQEAFRFRQLERQWFETREAPDDLKDGFLWEIDFPGDEKKKLPIGRSAMQRLEGLANLAAQRARIDRQVNVLTVRGPLGQSLIRRFILERRPITVQHVERAMSEAARVASKSLKMTTHFLPCHLMRVRQPTRFQLGPVSFIQQSEFRRVLANSLWARRSDEKRHWQLIREVSRYYKSFGWVAEITVPDCDDETSKSVASATVIAALNCLHLFFGARQTGRMTVGGPEIRRDRRGHFTVENERFDFSASFGGPGEVGFEDDWLKFFQEPGAPEFLELFGVALESASDPRHERPLSDRFLDAALWYGEAVREQSPAAKVIKYVTALERMFMSDEKDNITDIVSRRVAAFCCDPGEPGDFEAWQKRTQKAYGLRSKLAHGSMSPKDIAVFEGVRIGAEIGRDALLAGLGAFGNCGLRQEDIPRKDIARWFENCVDQIEAVRAR